MTRVAAVDCGTNSIRLLIADVEAGRVHDVARCMRIVRLGEDVDSTGRLADAALERTFRAAEEFRDIIAAEGPMPIRFVATSATRDASNRDEFFHGIESRLGVAEVISGEEEAALSFMGATAGAAAAIPGGLPHPCLVMDLGGGSTELVSGRDSVESAYSMDIGCVRMTERHIRHDPPSAAEIADIEADVDAAFATAVEHVDVRSARALVGVAGTITTLTAMVWKLPAYDPAVIHGTQMSRAELEATTEQLLSMSAADRAALPFMHPGRVDVIVGGAIVFRRFVQRICDVVGEDIPLYASESDILDGIALDLASRSR